LKPGFYHTIADALGAEYVDLGDNDPIPPTIFELHLRADWRVFTGATYRSV